MGFFDGGRSVESTSSDCNGSVKLTFSNLTKPVGSLPKWIVRFISQVVVSFDMMLLVLNAKGKRVNTIYAEGLGHVETIVPNSGSRRTLGRFAGHGG